MEIFRQVVGAARQTDSWDPGLLAVRVLRMCRLVLNPRLHLSVRRALAPTNLAKTYPRTAFKYLGTHLARSLSVTDRAAILAHHYSYLNRRIAAASLTKILFDALPLWQASRESLDLGIYLAFSHPDDREGELSLIFHANATDVFTLSFTISPGRVLGIEAEQAFLVSRLQGSKGCNDKIREISRIVDDVSPAAMLVAALAGMAEALDIKDMVSIGAEEQVAKKVARASTYDDFWTSLGARPLHGTFFHVELPLPEKPITQIKQNHRARTNAKRRLKKQIADHVCGEFARHLGDHAAQAGP
ncbi:MAG: DUF535 family protein [Rhodocyclaceae bacterium]|nr:DUF535 family protein [Rhodocyclaceae bacterium]